MERSLPIRYPSITSWTWIANTFAILETYDNTKEWLYNNFVNLFCETYDEWVSLHYLPHVEVFSISPFFKSALLERKIIRSISPDIITFIKKCIDLDYYVYCKVDDHFISKDHKLLHELLIYGYNDSNSQFDIADFTLSDSQKYTFSKTSYKNIQLSIDAVMDEEDDMQDGIGGDGGIFIFCVNKHQKYSFNAELFKAYLDDYISCKCSSNLYRTNKLEIPTSFSVGLKKIRCGLAVYDTLIEYCTNLIEGKNYFYIQSFHVLYKHKKLMLNRLRYLKDKLNFQISESILSEFESLLIHAEIIRNLGIKYLLQRDTIVLKKIKQLLKELKDEDEKACLKLFQVLCKL